MASKLFLPLIVLIVRFGVECKKGIEIETISKKVDGPDGAEAHVGATISFAGSNVENSAMSKKQTTSGFDCFDKTSGSTILQRFHSNNKWSINLNIAIDSGEFLSHDKQKKNLENMVGDRYCFVYGTLWPQEKATSLLSGSNIFQLYLNFLTNSPPFQYHEFFHLKSVVEKGNIISTLAVDRLFPRVKSSLVKEQSDKFFEGLKNNAKNNKRSQETTDIINTCTDEGTFCINNLECENKGQESEFNFNTISIKLKGDVKLYMAFPSKQIYPEKLVEAALNFATEGPKSKSLTTDFANLECLAEGIKLTDSKILV